eukprot:1129625-Prymnesium_polylepis.1
MKKSGWSLARLMKPLPKWPKLSSRSSQSALSRAMPTDARSRARRVDGPSFHCNSVHGGTPGARATGGARTCAHARARAGMRAKG